MMQCAAPSTLFDSGRDFRIAKQIPGGIKVLRRAQLILASFDPVEEVVERARINARPGRSGTKPGLVDDWIEEWMGSAAFVRAPTEKVIVTISDVSLVEYFYS